MKIRIGLVFNLCVIPRYTYTVMDCYAAEVMGLVFFSLSRFRDLKRNNDSKLTLINLTYFLRRIINILNCYQ